MQKLADQLLVWWRLARGEHAVMTFLAIVASAVIATGKFSPKFLLFALGPALIVLGSFIFNDYLDIASDKALGRKERPLVSKQVSPRAALYASAVLFGSGLAFCWSSNFIGFEIAFAYSLLSVAYSAFLKKLPLLGNAVTATTYGISFLYGNAVAANSLALNDLNLLVVSFGVFAFLAGLGRELLITIRDVEGDKKIGALTLPMVLGARITAWLAAFLLLCAIAATYFPIANNYLSDASLWCYALLVGACDVLLFYCAHSALSDSSRQNLSKIRNYSLKAFQIALLGLFLLAVLQFI